MSLKRGLSVCGVLIFTLAILASAGTAQAATLVLGNSGWTASWDPAFEHGDQSYVTLSVLAETSDAIVIQKVAVFADGPDQNGLIEPITINFEQTKSDAVQNIVISSESVTNATGVDWTSFQFIIEDGTTGTSADTSFNLDQSFNVVPPFKTSPFSVISTGGPTVQPQIITLGDGVVADGEIWRPGVGPDGGDLVINAAPSETGTQRFVFKELPQGQPIPLPAAALTGLSSLLGLGIVNALRRARQTIA